MGEAYPYHLMTRILKLRQDAHPCGPRHKFLILSIIRSGGYFFDLFDFDQTRILCYCCESSEIAPVRVVAGSHSNVDHHVGETPLSEKGALNP